jgi:DNA mismatch endonuclease (patch repair protein)
MSRVSGKNTKPEVFVRSLLHKMGYRFRLHRKDLPGKPDIILPRHKKIIFVHGCFWHGHNNCLRAKRPKSNINFWNEKLDKNISRDNANLIKLQELGWKVLVVWTCEINNTAFLKQKLESFFHDETEN